MIMKMDSAVVVAFLTVHYTDSPSGAGSYLESCAVKAVSQIRKWLIDPAYEEGKEGDENLFLLHTAAAALAYYYLLLGEEAKQPSGQFSANGVSVKPDYDEKLKKARTLAKENLLAASHLIHVPVSGFAFLSTKE